MVLDLAEVQALEGFVDYSSQKFLGLRSDHGLYRFRGLNFGCAAVALTFHVFTGDLGAARSVAI